MTESVEVTGGEPLDVTRPDVSHRVDEKYYHDLPIVTAGDVRLAESVLQMQPGYLPMSPNGDPTLRGSQFASRINGGQIRATENFFDGAAFGNAFAHQESQESAPPWRPSRRSGSSARPTPPSTVIRAAASSSTPPSRARTACGEAPTAIWRATRSTPRASLRRPRVRSTTRSWGGTLGGPIVKNKTFFFVNADWTQFRSGTLEGFGKHDADRRL